MIDIAFVEQSIDIFYEYFRFIGFNRKDEELSVLSIILEQSLTNVKCKAFTVGCISKSMMNDIPSAPIGDFENTLSFPSEETSLGSGLPSHLLLRDVPCPSSPSHGFLHHTI
ncbi:MAG: hypothetical protein KAT01_03720 [Candidatus Aminicenantes bacterium]|nr:hypothetical protein [Candidatus Aminicenantes bacterium]